MGLLFLTLIVPPIVGVVPTSSFDPSGSETRMVPVKQP